MIRPPNTKYQPKAITSYKCLTSSGLTGLHIMTLKRYALLDHHLRANELAPQATFSIPRDSAAIMFGLLIILC